MKPNGTKQLFAACILGALSLVGCETNKPTTNTATPHPQAIGAPQVPIPQTAAEVSGPAPGPMTKEYVQTVGFTDLLMLMETAPEAPVLEFRSVYEVRGLEYEEAVRFGDS